MLVLAAQEGDSEAFSELFRRHYQQVRRVCARKLRDIREGDEIAQAAFVKAYERLDHCGGDRRFGAWVQVIANNLCIDHMRAQARTTPTEAPVGENEGTSHNPPEEAVLQSEQAALIQRALASLPDRQRDVVVARDVDGRRPPEIAAAFGLTLGAVDSLLLRARRRLAASMQSMQADSGAASLATTAAVSAVGGTAANIGPVARAVEAVGQAVAAASYHVASAIGMVPGVSSAVTNVAPAAAAGLVALSPGGAALHQPQMPVLNAPIVVNLPAPIDAPSLLTPRTGTDVGAAITDLLAPITQELPVVTAPPAIVPALPKNVSVVGAVLDSLSAVVDLATDRSSAQ